MKCPNCKSQRIILVNRFKTVDGKTRYRLMCQSCWHTWNSKKKVSK